MRVLRNYGEFRPAYNSLIRLRQSIPDIPMLALSATLMEPDIEDVRRAMNMRDPIIIRRSIRRKNLTLWFAAIKSPLFEDLDILIADGITTAEDIPQTLIYVDSQLEANRIARHLRKRLPPSLGLHKRDIIRAYSSPLDHSSKEFTMDQLFIGNTRIAICTEALGLGVHIRAIPRVVQWKLHSTLTLNDWYQRIGRAGRDTDDECLGIVAKVARKYKNEIDLELCGSPEETMYDFHPRLRLRSMTAIASLSQTSYAFKRDTDYIAIPKQFRLILNENI